MAFRKKNFIRFCTLQNGRRPEIEENLFVFWFQNSAGGVIPFLSVRGNLIKLGNNTHSYFSSLKQGNIVLSTLIFRFSYRYSRRLYQAKTRHG